MLKISPLKQQLGLDGKRTPLYNVLMKHMTTKENAPVKEDTQVSASMQAVQNSLYLALDGLAHIVFETVIWEVLPELTPKADKQIDSVCARVSGSILSEEDKTERFLGVMGLTPELVPGAAYLRSIPEEACETVSPTNDAARKVVREAVEAIDAMRGATRLAMRIKSSLYRACLEARIAGEGVESCVDDVDEEYVWAALERLCQRHCVPEMMVPIANGVPVDDVMA